MARVSPTETDPLLGLFLQQGFIRGLIALTSYVPLPASALVTPVSFRVRCRELRGILSEFDEYERGGAKYTGSGKGRELTGEWVVDKALWAGWQNEFKQGKSKRRRSGEGEPKEKAGGMKGGDRIVLYLHGGQSRRRTVISDSDEC